MRETEHCCQHRGKSTPSRRQRHIALARCQNVTGTLHRFRARRADGDSLLSRTPCDPLLRLAGSNRAAQRFADRFVDGQNRNSRPACTASIPWPRAGAAPRFRQRRRSAHQRPRLTTSRSERLGRGQTTRSARRNRAEHGLRSPLPGPTPSAASRKPWTRCGSTATPERRPSQLSEAGDQPHFGDVVAVNGIDSNRRPLPYHGAPRASSGSVRSRDGPHNRLVPPDRNDATGGEMALVSERCTPLVPSPTAWGVGAAMGSGPLPRWCGRPLVGKVRVSGSTRLISGATRFCQGRPDRAEPTEPRSGVLDRLLAVELARIVHQAAAAPMVGAAGLSA